MKITKVSIGDNMKDSIGKIKILCFVEKNYVVAKRPKCVPFIITIKKLVRQFDPVEK